MGLQPLAESRFAKILRQEIRDDKDFFPTQKNTIRLTIFSNLIR